MRIRPVRGRLPEVGAAKPRIFRASLWCLLAVVRRAAAFFVAGGTNFQVKEVTTVPTPAKEQTIAEVTELLSNVQGTIVTDYRGLTVEQITTLRKRLRPAKARYQVVKNPRSSASP